MTRVRCVVYRKIPQLAELFPTVLVVAGEAGPGETALMAPQLLRPTETHSRVFYFNRMPSALTMVT